MGVKSRAARLYGVDDIRVEDFDLPEIADDEILVKVVTDSVCMSTYKLAKQGKAHKRCPQDIDRNPVIIGHEFAGDIVKVGRKWKGEFKEGERFAQQPALNYKGSLASPGYSYRFFGGDATYCIIPHEVMELGCLLHYSGAYFNASLGEPVSCVIGGYNVMYHTNKKNYEHSKGIKEGGCAVILGGAGPMGLAAAEYALTLEKKPKTLAVVDVDERRLARARELISEERAKSCGINLVFVNSSKMASAYDGLMALSEGKGFDDVFVYAPIVELAELGNRVLAFDGCMNFFAGPQDKNFKANINLYDCHYTSTHILGNTGGNTDDLKEALRLSSQGRINPAVMVTHICGLGAIPQTVINLPALKAGKVLCYTHADFPLTAIADFENAAKENPLFGLLDEACKRHNGLWNAEAENIVLENLQD